MFTLEMETSNAAFEDGGGRSFEIARILRQLADRLELERFARHESGKLYDTNGNHVGSWDFERDA